MLTAMDMCLHMFISIPLPPGKWDDSLRKQRTACLPLLGLLIGAIVYLQLVALLLAYVVAPAAVTRNLLLTGAGLLVVLRLMKRLLPEVSAS